MPRLVVGAELDIRHASVNAGAEPRHEDAIGLERKLSSQKALAILRGAGFSRLKNLTGGIDRWAREVDPSLPLY